MAIDSDVIRPTLNQGIDILRGRHRGPHGLRSGRALCRLGRGAVQGPRVQGPARQDRAGRSRLAAASACSGWTTSTTRGARARRLQPRWGSRRRVGAVLLSGPDYTKRREICTWRLRRSPTSSFAPTWTDYAFDFTGDGWTDVLTGESRPMTLYVNPKGENRRWVRPSRAAADHRRVHGDAGSRWRWHAGDRLRDGRLGGTLAFAKVHPTDPTQPWPMCRSPSPASHTATVWARATSTATVASTWCRPAGWWEQPAAGATAGPWPYHPVAFGRWGRAEGAGGARHGGVRRQRRRAATTSSPVSTRTASAWPGSSRSAMPAARSRSCGT